MTLSEKFYNMLDRLDKDESVKEEMFKMVMEAPDSYERDGMLALIYHDGIGVDIDLKKSFEYAEKAVYALSDYYWDLVMPNYPDDEEWCEFENILETDSDLSDDEREEIKRKIKEWHNMADEIYEESLDDEPENIIEED
ncbi:MAG: SEL1-like repeat protein [Muribaculaceae bacterium]|nr:SEL1-like repeat protein [Muribaculaceae bacterium]